VNDFAIYIDEVNNCKKCKGLKSCLNSNEGYCSKIENEAFVLAPCKYKKEAIKQSKKDHLIGTLFVSKHILNATFDQYEVSTPNRIKIYDYIQNFIQALENHQYAKGLYIYGGFATGKTFILGCIANELAQHHIQSLVIYFPDLVVELKNAMGDSTRFEELMNYLKSVDVLMLDDLGSENMTSWLRDEVLGPVLNYRLMEEKPVFISSNIDPTTDQLVNHLSITRSPQDSLKGSRIQSRLEGLVNTIELENASYKR
ncbi:MAG: ATP-binding protein, partial [Anaeroplasmataceae bacterium]|nr:ATP-binding protein [Anaeroplasmataceae bacterium]